MLEWVSWTSTNTSETVFLILHFPTQLCALLDIQAVHVCSTLSFQHGHKWCIRLPFFQVTLKYRDAKKADVQFFFH